MSFDPSRFTYALVTSTTYGNWLPGDSRGYVAENNVYGMPFDRPDTVLEKSSRERMKEPTIFFDELQARLIFDRWRECAVEIEGELVAVAIMPNHFHLIVVVPGKANEKTKGKLLQFFKGRASRVLNKQFGKRTWWTDSGSVRYSFDKQVFRARIEYVKNQANALLWENPEFANKEPGTERSAVPGV